MELTFERTVTVGNGSEPQAVHDQRGPLRIFYLSSGIIKEFRADPLLGQYSDLTWEDEGRASPDSGVTLPSLKRVMHFGAFGYWNAAGDHRFVTYMMPTDISNTLINGSISHSIQDNISTLSLDLVNIRNILINRSRALTTPGTIVQIYFSLGNSGEISIGRFYVDRASGSYPELKVALSGRNAIGKILKEQTFDEETEWDEGSTHDNIEAIMEYAEVEDFFIGDPGTDAALTFEPKTTILEGIGYAIELIPNWQIAETLDGVVGVGLKTDARFDAPAIYTFERDKTCWEYSYEYDDSDAAARVHVYAQGVEQSDPTNEAYAEVSYNKWWTQAPHRTLHVETVKGATTQQCQNVANTLAASLSASGRVETFAGLFTPQLTIGDEVRVQVGTDTETIGTVTDVQHTFGQDGFVTQFTVDSGGRKGRARLKDLIETASKFPETFTGVQTPTADGDEVEY